MSEDDGNSGFAGTNLTCLELTVLRKWLLFFHSLLQRQRSGRGIK